MNSEMLIPNVTISGYLEPPPRLSVWFAAPNDDGKTCDLIEMAVVALGVEKGTGQLYNIVYDVDFGGYRCPDNDNDFLGAAVGKTSEIATAYTNQSEMVERAWQAKNRRTRPANEPQTENAGAHALYNWLHDQRLPYKEAARMFGVRPESISRYLNGERQPSRESASSIYRVAGIPERLWSETITVN